MDRRDPRRWRPSGRLDRHGPAGLAMTKVTVTAKAHPFVIARAQPEAIQATARIAKTRADAPAAADYSQSIRPVSNRCVSRS